MVNGFEEVKITEITDFYKAPLQSPFIKINMTRFSYSRQIFQLGLFYLAMLSGAHLKGQHTDADVMAPIYRMFEGMTKSDTTLLQSSFNSSISFSTLNILPNGELTLARENDAQNFKKAISQLQPGYLQEPIFDVKVSHADGFAQVWAPYGLFVGGKFRHCGVDAFQLILTSEGWKIFHLADTRKKENCQIPEKIMKAYSR